MSSTSEEEKKKLRGEKFKYINKLNKTIEYTRKKKTTPLKTPLRELRKCYMFCINGDLPELKNLVDLLLST